MDRDRLLESERGAWVRWGLNVVIALVCAVLASQCQVQVQIPPPPKVRGDDGIPKAK